MSDDTYNLQPIEQFAQIHGECIEFMALNEDERIARVAAMLCMQWLHAAERIDYYEDLINDRLPAGDPAIAAAKEKLQFWADMEEVIRAIDRVFGRGRGSAWASPDYDLGRRQMLDKLLIDIRDRNILEGLLHIG